MQRKVDESKKDYSEELAKQKTEPLRNHNLKEDYNAMYFNSAR